MNNSTEQTEAIGLRLKVGIMDRLRVVSAQIKLPMSEIASSAIDNYITPIEVAEAEKAAARLEAARG